MMELVVPMTDQLTILECPFHVESQSRDNIPVEFMTNLQHYVSGQEIPWTPVRAPWTSYYAMYQGAPLLIANYARVWFETTL